MDTSVDNNLKQEIIKTLVWFDTFSYPLTAFEIYKYLNYKTSYSEVVLALEELSDKIVSSDGFFFLRGREALITERFKKFNYLKRKNKRAKAFVKLISLWPSVLGVAVSNIIGDHNLRDSGDIDLLIISAPSRIWSCRFICTFMAKILGLRPNKKTKQDKICLSFYISSDNLNLESYLYNDRDFYFVYCLNDLDIIYNYKNIWEKFYQANTFLFKYLPNRSDLSVFPDKQVVKTKFKLFSINKKIGDKLEKFLKQLQLKIMPVALKEQVGQSTGVILEDNIIKLFLEDKRLDFINRFDKRIKEILNK
jgi:hypothetical protein